MFVLPMKKGEEDITKIFEDDFGNNFDSKLSLAAINPSSTLGGNTQSVGSGLQTTVSGSSDFDNMDTPNSFKCGAGDLLSNYNLLKTPVCPTTPFTPFGLSSFNNFFGSFPNQTQTTNQTEQVVNTTSTGSNSKNTSPSTSNKQNKQDQGTFESGNDLNLPNVPNMASFQANLTHLAQNLPNLPNLYVPNAMQGMTPFNRAQSNVESFMVSPGKFSKSQSLDDLNKINQPTQANPNMFNQNQVYQHGIPIKQEPFTGQAVYFNPGAYSKPTFGSNPRSTLQRSLHMVQASKDENRWKSWSREEEVFLIGAVMDRFFKRGSLSSTRLDETTNDDCWSYIKQNYDKAWSNYKLRTNDVIPPDRSMNALSRHYKVMKARISQADMNGEQVDDFRTYYDEWEKIYNVNDCLINSSSNFDPNNVVTHIITNPLMNNYHSSVGGTTNLGTQSLHQPQQQQQQMLMQHQLQQSMTTQDSEAFRKRKVRLSTRGELVKNETYINNDVDKDTRRSSAKSTDSRASPSSTHSVSSFIEEGGCVIRQEEEALEDFF